MGRMRDLPVILFPHSYLSKPDIKQILSFFGPLTIFQPWFLERPIPLSEGGDSNSIQILRPPSNLKPSEDFKILLSEYHEWIKRNQDKGYMEFLKVSQDIDPNETSTWVIRRHLRQMEHHVSIPEEDHTLRWHLILHLAQEVEDQRFEADRMLKVLKEKRSPLEGAVEAADGTKGLLEDLTQFESEAIVDEYNLRQIFEAWFALFGEYVKGKALLITFTRKVMDYINELWRDFGIEGYDSAIRFKSPDLSHHTLEGLARIKSEYFNDGKIRGFRDLILDFRDSPINNLSRLEELSREFEGACPWDLSRGTLNIVVQYLGPVPDNERLKIDSLTKHLSGKIIVLVEA